MEIGYLGWLEAGTAAMDRIESTTRRLAGWED